MAFAFIAGFSGMDILIFVGIMMSGVVASIVIGAIVGNGNIVVDYLTFGSETPLWHSFEIIWANIAVLAIVFAVIYEMKGLKD